jgi:hypothetical protein
MTTLKTLLIVLCFCLACDDDDSKKSDCVGESDLVAMCPDVLDPVCGCNGVTYDNSCKAKAAGVKSWSAGKCN